MYSCFIVCLYLYWRWQKTVSNYQEEEGWNTINRFNPDTTLSPVLFVNYLAGEGGIHFIQLLSKYSTSVSCPVVQSRRLVSLFVLTSIYAGASKKEGASPVL